LWVSVAGLLVAGVWGVYSNGQKLGALVAPEKKPAEASSAGAEVESRNVAGAVEETGKRGDEEADEPGVVETGERADYWRKRLPAGTAVIERAPFVYAGDLTAEELAAWHERTVRPAAAALGTMYFETKPSRAISILLYGGPESYQKAVRTYFGRAPVTKFGFYLGDERTLVMDISTGGGTLVHELTHALAKFDFPEQPDWFNEGLASLYEQSEFGRDGRSIRGLVNWRLPALQAALGEGRLQPLAQLLRRDDFRGRETALNYAQARYLCLYLQEQGRLEAFYREFRRTQAGDPRGEAALVAMFPGKTLEEVDREFRRWAGGLFPP
jgi:hypothetical protein